MRCPVCKNKMNFNLVEAWNEFRIYHCKECDVVFSNPMKAPDSSWHEEAYVERNVNLRNYTHLTPNCRFFLTRKQFRGGRLLDIGCGDGLFLKFASKYYDAWGIDIDGEAIKAARRKYHLANVYNTMTMGEFIKRFPEVRFDVVTLFEVLEHVDDPLKLIRETYQVLKPRGILVLSVPNRERMNARHDPHDRPPNHLTRWSAEAVKNLLNRERFRVIRLYRWKTELYGFF